MNLTDEGSIIERCKKGDREAFASIVQQYMKPAYYVALGMSGDRTTPWISRRTPSSTLPAHQAVRLFEEVLPVVLQHPQELVHEPYRQNPAAAGILD